MMKRAQATTCATVSVKSMRWALITVATTILALGSASSMGDQFYKCNVGGKISYQAVPCKEGKSNQVKTPTGPSQEEVRAAQQRALQEESMATAGAPSPDASQPSTPTTVPKGKADCSGLSAQRQQAFSRRNAALARARQGDGVKAGSSEDVSIGQMQAEIASIESNMRSHGCSF